MNFTDDLDKEKILSTFKYELLQIIQSQTYTGETF